MLRPATVTSLLSELVNAAPTSAETDLVPSAAARPHTALLSLLESSELYAYATRLGDLGSVPSSASHRQHARSKSIPLSPDERATCLSAIAVAAWRNATSPSGSGSGSSDPLVVSPGMRVQLSKYSLGSADSAAKKGPGQSNGHELVPLLLECDLGRILVMPIVPAPASTARTDSSADRDDDAQTGTAPGPEASKPFMLLSLNSSGSGSSVAGMSDHFPRSGGATPTSTLSAATGTPTPARSPGGGSVTSAFEASEVPQSGASASNGGQGREDDSGAADHEAVWGILYAQAKAVARHLAPSLAKCGVGAGALHDDVHGEHRSSQTMSEDEHDD